ncbi:FecR family protein [Candidatus Gracilibacteria bacterium]|nr:FecR family protein [Candidatus Gracilibacteria bacterium]
MKNFLKGKIKNKFIISILLIIGLIIGVQLFISSKGVDTNSYVVLVKGEVSVGDEQLGQEERIMLEVGDEIITKDDSICVVEWGDGSLTRLGENGKITIEELNIEEDLSKINLQFKLTEGKTWSNVVSFLGEKSYFKQNFEDIEASVRGTVFDVNLGTDTIFVQDHEVALDNGEQQKIVKEGTAFNFKTFSLVEITEFLNNIRDRAWEDYNKTGDDKYFEKLKQELLKSFSSENVTAIVTDKIGSSAGDLDELEKNISTFTGEKKQQAYDSLLTQYQKLNFVSADDGELFTQKNNIKKALIAAAGDEDKKSLVQYSIYDLKDAMDGENLDAIKNTISLIGKNKDILGELNIDVLSDISIIPEGLEGVISDQFDTVSELFKNTPNIDINLDSISDILKSKTTDAVNGVTTIFKNLNK